MFREQHEQPYGVEKKYWFKLHQMLAEALGEEGENVEAVARIMVGIARNSETQGGEVVSSRGVSIQLRLLVQSTQQAARGYLPDIGLVDAEKRDLVDTLPTPPGAFHLLVTKLLELTIDQKRIAQSLTVIGLTNKHIHAIFKADIGQIIDDAVMTSRSRLPVVDERAVEDSENRRLNRPIHGSVTSFSVISEATERVLHKTGMATEGEATSDLLNRLSQQQLNALADAVDQELRR